MKIKLLASDSCERGHRRGEWALGSNVKLMAGISVPVPSVNDGAIADSLGPPSESGRELQLGGFMETKNRKIDFLRAVCGIKSIHESHCTVCLR